MEVCLLLIVIVLLIVSISRFKVHPFLALLVFGLAYGIASGIDPVESVGLLLEGFARTLQWIAVIMICGAIAAMMSTADSQLLMSASAVSEDVYRRLLRPRAGDRELLAVGRWATLAVGVVGFVLAWRGTDFVYSLVLYAWAGLGAAFGPPLLLSLWWRGTSRTGVLAGFVTGTVVVVVWYFVPGLGDRIYEMIPGFFASLAATWLGSRLGPASGQGAVQGGAARNARRSMS